MELTLVLFRRYVGQYFPKLAKLITANAKTLRIIGKIGLTEAIEGFNENVSVLTTFIFISLFKLSVIYLNNDCRLHLHAFHSLTLTWSVKNNLNWIMMNYR